MAKPKKRFKQTSDIKVGVIGYGGAFNMGRKHLEEMKQAGMTPFAVCEIDPERLKVAEEDFPGIETYDSLDKMLKQSDVNLIVHITPHNLHYPLAAKCVKAGKHVVTEKPFVIGTTQADRLIKAAKENDVVVSTYHNRHWDGWILKAVKEVVDNKKIGDVYRVDLTFGNYSMPRDWWRTSKSISGGVLYDWGCHLLEYALQLTPGNLTEVSGYAQHGHWEAQAPKGFPFIGDMNEDDASLVARFDTGAHIHLRVSHLNAEAGVPFMKVYGTKGVYIMLNMGGAKSDKPGWLMRRVLKSGKISETTGNHVKSRGELFYKNVAGYLTGKEELIITPEWARRPIHILDLADKSATKGKAVKAKYG